MDQAVRADRLCSCRACERIGGAARPDSGCLCGTVRFTPRRSTVIARVPAGAREWLGAKLADRRRLCSDVPGRLCGEPDSDRLLRWDHAVAPGPVDPSWALSL